MGLFRHSSDGPRDGALTLLSEADADCLRTMVRTAFAERGREVTVYADYVADLSGNEYGLWNLATVAAATPRRKWAAVVHTHVQLLIEPSHDLDGLDPRSFRNALYLRLVEAPSLPDPSAYPHALQVAGDLVALLSVDLPESVATPAAKDLRERGAIDELMETGRANLRRLLDSGGIESEVVSPSAGGAFRIVIGDSFFTASLSLLLAETARRFGSEIDAARGALVAVPNRHLLGFRLVDGPDAALGLNHLFGLAIRQYGEAPGPLSPHVYWVRNGEWIQVTHFDEEGRPCVDVSADLAEALSLGD